MELWVRLCRLCGTNYLVTAERRGTQLAFTLHGRRFRVPAADMEAGRLVIRGSWAISAWNAAAAETVAQEANWQA